MNTEQQKQQRPPGPSPSQFLEILGLAGEWLDWQEKNFHWQSDRELLEHLREEVDELEQELTNKAHAQMPEGLPDWIVLRKRVAVEAADVAILAMRLIQKQDRDPLVEILEKWKKVKLRKFDENGRKVEPDEPSEDYLTMIERLSDDKPFVVKCKAGAPGTPDLYLAVTEGTGHFTSSRKFALGFDTVAEAQVYAKEVVIYTAPGKTTGLGSFRVVDRETGEVELA